MTKDLNKGISNISYNLLNLPQQVDILSPVGEARNTYSYSADGEKLRVVKKYNSGFNTSPIIGSAVNTSNLNVTKTTDYVDGKIFENNTLDRILVDGGYIKDGIYYFYETDHLGDNRTVINQSGTVVERNDYYPYGMQMAHNQMLNQASGSDNKRKFSGKELDVMHGLNLYDSQARSYDPTLERFTTVDPLCEKYYDISPYAYCGGNPLSRVDPDGRQFGISPFLLGSNNPFLPLGRAAMLSSSDKIVRVLPKEEHHLIPKSLKNNEVVKTAREGDFKLDGKENKLKVDKFSKETGEGQHAKHQNYTEQIESKLQKVQEDNPNISPKEAANEVRKIISNAKNDIQNNPNTKINDLKLNQINVAPSDNTKVTLPVIPDPRQSNPSPTKTNVDWQPAWKIENKI